MTERELFEAALDQKPGDRAAFLELACAGAPTIRKRLEALLAWQEKGESNLGDGAEGPHADDSWPNGASPAPKPPTRCWPAATS